MFYGAKPKLFEYASEPRENMTIPEKLLWEHHKESKLGLRFKAQHPIDIFIADFYCHKVKLVIELDGEIHKSQREYDIGRSCELEEFGLKVIRFTNEEVIHKIYSVLSTIQKKLKERL